MLVSRQTLVSVPLLICAENGEGVRYKSQKSKTVNPAEAYAR